MEFNDNELHFIHEVLDKELYFREPDNKGKDLLISLISNLVSDEADKIESDSFDGPDYPEEFKNKDMKLAASIVSKLHGE